MTCLGKFAALAGLAGMVLACAEPGSADAMVFPVTCNIVGNSDAALGEQACVEFIKTLGQTYPDVTFANDPAVDAPGLEIIVHKASKSVLGVQLKWRDASGLTTVGDPLSVVMMDRDLGMSRRQSLYLRALAATPMPKQN